MSEPSRRSLDVLRLLLARGADVNTREPDLQRTPLMLAVAEGSRELVRALLDGGADVHARDADGQTALNLARAFEIASLPRAHVSSGR